MFQLQKSFLRLAIPTLTCSLIVQAQMRRPMTHHVREVTRTGQARFVQRMPLDHAMQLDLVLPLSDRAGLDTFLKQVNDPSSASYHHYLTPAEFTARFGPTQAQYDAVLNFAKDNGFTVTGGTRDGMDVQITAPVMAVENAFHISMATYQHPTENRTFYAPDREPTLALPFQIWHISGLNNYSIPKPKHEKRNEYAQAHGVSSENVLSRATSGSGPSASFLGSDMRTAYYGSGPLTGANQTLGLLEYQGTNLSDVSLYYRNAGQTQPLTPVLVSADGASTSCRGNCDDTEPTIDITQALGMAPGLKALVVYVGNSDTAILSAMTTTSKYKDLPMTIGCSGGWSPADPGAIDVYFQKMQAQGQTFFVASGDNSTWTASNYEWPADDPYVVTVGGTDLVTTGASGDWLSETAWVNSGGGISTDYIGIPSWQQIPAVIDNNNGASATLRNGPDVAANADFSFYVCANRVCTANHVGGTSFAAPMWAAYTALANERAANTGSAPAGFINPTIYAQNADPSTYAANFHDIGAGVSGSYAAVAGYDLVTGWGSPTPRLIDAMIGHPPGAFGSFNLTMTQNSGVSFKGATVLLSSITVQPLDGFAANVLFSVSGAPSGVTLSFSPSSVAPGNPSEIAVKVLNSAKAGTYKITITGVSGSVIKTVPFTLTVK